MLKQAQQPMEDSMRASNNLLQTPTSSKGGKDEEEEKN
jgi:hypothetical protein